MGRFLYHASDQSQSIEIAPTVNQGEVFSSYSRRTHRLTPIMAPILNQVAQQLRGTLGQIRLNGIVVPSGRVLESQNARIRQILWQSLSNPAIRRTIFVLVRPGGCIFTA